MKITLWKFLHLAVVVDYWKMCQKSALDLALFRGVVGSQEAFIVDPMEPTFHNSVVRVANCLPSLVPLRLDWDSGIGVWIYFVGIEEWDKYSICTRLLCYHNE